MHSVELPKMDKLVKASIFLLELASRLCPYIEYKDVACIVIPMENYVSYLERVIQLVLICIDYPGWKKLLESSQR